MNFEFKGLGNFKQGEFDDDRVLIDGFLSAAI